MNSVALLERSVPEFVIVAHLPKHLTYIGTVQVGLGGVLTLSLIHI